MTQQTVANGIAPELILPDLILQDTQHRIAALTLQSYIVEAPAGAGKTELLTQRYLKLLAVVDAPEEIIALTFTNKAAAEMRNRILKSLEAAQNNEPIDAPHKQQTRQLALAALQHAARQQWQLLAQPSRLRILTIDALCSSLAAQMPLLSRLGGQPKVADDPDAHYLEAAKRTLAMVAQEKALDAPISTVLTFMQNDTQKLADLLASMLAKREQWLPLIGTHQAISVDVISAQCAHILNSCIQDKLHDAQQAFPDRLQTMLMPVARFVANNLGAEHAFYQLLDWQEPLTTQADQLNDWLVLLQLIFTNDGELRKTGGLNVKMGFPKDHPDKKTHIETFEQVTNSVQNTKPLLSLRQLPLVTAQDLAENSRIVQAFSSVLQYAAAHLLQVFQSAGEVDFVAIARAAINALNDEQGATDLALKLDYKIAHLLVDEFQDTNATQKELLELLTAGWEPNGQRTLFCVGDPMQSIYRFRKADVSLFLQAASNGIGHLPLQALKLSRNNRSHPKIVEWINQHFTHIFPKEDNTLEAAIKYRDFIATRDSIADEGVQVHPLVVQSDEESALANAYEARYVAELIDQEQQRDAQQSIAVLVRSRTHLHDLVSEIRRNFPHLKFQAVEIEALHTRQTVQDALSLTRAMLHRADRVHWLNVLRAPWCGLTLADLHSLCAHDHHATIWQLMQHGEHLSEDGKVRLQHVQSILAQAFAHQGRMPLRRWIESTWLQLGGGSTLVNAGDIRDVQTFFDLIEKLANGHVLDFAQLESAMQKLYAEPDVAGNEQLQFLTIHKSKGLEFDCVVLPALNRKPRQPDAPLMLWEEVQTEGRTQLLAAPYSKTKKQSAPNIYDYIKQLEATRANNETARLLYVAATRTIRKLHLVAIAKRKENNDITPAKQSLLELLWPSIQQFFELVEAKPLQNTNTQTLADFIPKLMRLEQPVLPTALQNVQITHVQPNVNSDHIAPKTLVADTLSTDKGTLTHLYLELISRTGLAQWTAQRLLECKPAMHNWLQQQGHMHAISLHAADDVIHLLQTTLNSTDGQWVLKARPMATSELAMETASDTQVSKKIIDRTFVENGTRWIVDYKTTTISVEADETMLKLFAEQFRAQLEGYAQLFANERLPIQKAILFVSLGKLITL
ncbi:MAG: UvrD-helicase domain-containing protein [Methylophilus sp.]|nr:UvrD-helicase domain-containing protein [Methylophilus sp.]